ncbi:hemolysin family protein (plasmid) [Deinococcus sp. KNUC1210]|uniref:hemolysin family protein n=1 Tax=Deinococcus sp. KNUC1210 TaxID=2917691 RepID=UPI001EF01D46|nr:hemolysin family protein [Deinococcus sp. KNUC1210]ULH17626.1 hemolysin family protein [Deinococcus sp. KNUC1210]
MSAVVPVLVILVLVAVNAFYVAAEFATVGARRSRVQEAAEQGNHSAAQLLNVLRDPQQLDTQVAACQVGITLSSLIAGAYGEAQLAPLLAPALGTVSGSVLATIIVLALITTLQVVLGELLPKSVALRYPERLAIATLRPMLFSLWLFRPLISLFNGAAFVVLRAARLNTRHSHSHVHSPEELKGLYRESAAGGLIDAAERDMVAGVLNVERRVVREIMTPRIKLVSVSAQLTVQAALEQLAGKAYSRFPVTGVHADDVIGVVHLRALFLAAEKQPDQQVREVMRSPLIVTDSMPVPQLWQRLHGASRHSAVVVDERGSIVGLVTLEDAFEEILGEIQDEFDQEEDPIRAAGHRVTVRGDVRLDTLNDRFNLHLVTDEADTINGWLWSALGRLPMVGDEVASAEDGVHFRIEAMDRRAVQRVSFNLPEDRL